MFSEPPSNTSDADLFLLLQKGQTNTLAILYDRHAALVYGIALQVLSNRAEAEDLTQDIFLMLNGCSYDPQRGTLRTYLAILTRSRAMDRLRSRTRKQKKLRNRPPNENAKVVSDIPLESMAQLELSRTVQLALEQLSTQEREVLKMAYYDDLSQSEIAKQLNIALGTVKSRSRRGLLKLRQALIDLQGES